MALKVGTVFNYLQFPDVSHFPFVISKREGKTEKSSGFCIYTDVINITTEKAIEKERSRSSKNAGRGISITPNKEIILIATRTSPLLCIIKRNFIVMIPLSLTYRYEQVSEQLLYKVFQGYNH